MYIIINYMYYIIYYYVYYYLNTLQNARCNDKDDKDINIY